MACELGLVVTVASGSRLAARFAELAAEHDDGSALHVVLSDGARLVGADELGRQRAWSVSTPPSSAPTARSHPRCLRSTSLI